MQQQVSEKTIGAFEARRQFGDVLDSVVANGDKFVVERNGKPVAAVVPVQLYEQWKRRREAFFERIRAAAERSKAYEDLSEEEAMRIANEAVQAVRSNKPTI